MQSWRVCLAIIIHQSDGSAMTQAACATVRFAGGRAFNSHWLMTTLSMLTENFGLGVVYTCVVNN